MVIDQDLRGQIEVSLQNGRIHIPTKFHGVFTDKIRLATLPEKCLVISGPEYESFYDEVESQVVDYGTKSESFVVPSGLRIFAGLEKKVLVAGLGDRLELWNPDRWHHYEGYMLGYHPMQKAFRRNDPSVTT